MIVLPEHAPFTADHRRILESLLPELSPLQAGWLSGFLSSAERPVIPAPAVAAAKLTVLFGTESGNSEALADRAVKEAKRRGFQAVMKNMADCSASDLSKASNLLVVVSTWGDGEPPESAVGFHQDLMASEIDLKSLRFTVCALGDTSYEKFCQTGKDVDARLQALGARRVVERQDCDVDYEREFAGWLDRALVALAPAGGNASHPVPGVAAPAVEYGKNKPFPSELLDAVLLNGKGSAKETRHYEFSLAGSGLTYEPGDALAVIPRNAPDTVEAILDAAKLDGSTEIDTPSSGRLSLSDALASQFDITALCKTVLTKLNEAVDSPRLRMLLAEDAKDQLKNYMGGREIVDAIHEFAPDGLAAGALTGLFRKLPPRLYSISSSPLAHPDQVHLTVAAVRYASHGRERKGVCSTYLADMVKPGDEIPVYIHANKNFRLPADGATPVIMVGPGTGIAPFRAFVEHRAALGAPGKNWLIMGDQHYLYDFLYQLEWQDHLKNGSLARLDVAFSRDQPEKVYVQDCMIRRAGDIYAWLEEGAHFYVCGDASRMAADVHEALISIVQNQGSKSREQAESYVDHLKKSKRYQRDVY